MKKIYFQPKLKAHLDQELGRNGGEEGEKHQTNKTENAAFFYCIWRAKLGIVVDVGWCIKISICSPALSVTGNSGSCRTGFRLTPLTFLAMCRPGYMKIYRCLASQGSVLPPLLGVYTQVWKSWFAVRPTLRCCRADIEHKKDSRAQLPINYQYCSFHSCWLGVSGEVNVTYL